MSEDKKDGGMVRWMPGPARKALKLLAVAFVVQYLVVPQFAGARRAWELV